MVSIITPSPISLEQRNLDKTEQNTNTKQKETWDGIITLNVNGLFDDKKYKNVFKLFNNEAADIIL